MARDLVRPLHHPSFNYRAVRVGFSRTVFDNKFSESHFEFATLIQR